MSLSAQQNISIKIANRDANMKRKRRTSTDEIVTKSNNRLNFGNVVTALQEKRQVASSNQMLDSTTNTANETIK
jgi:hypothetical protein